MKLHLPSRLCFGAVLAALLSAVPVEAQMLRIRQARQAPPVRPRAMARPPGRVPPPQSPQGHLQEWMARHSNLSPAEQQRALENEPGFRELPPQTQQRMRDELNRLNNMPQPQRDRRLEQNEILERMSPPQRQQYRAAVQAFATMPPDRRRLMARAIIDLRQMPPEQRQAVIDSPRFRAQFSDPERSTLGNLLSVEPYPPIPTAAPPTP